jgi:hypothetical protein
VTGKDSVLTVFAFPGPVNALGLTCCQTSMYNARKQAIYACKAPSGRTRTVRSPVQGAQPLWWCMLIYCGHLTLLTHDVLNAGSKCLCDLQSPAPLCAKESAEVNQVCKVWDQVLLLGK